MILVIILLGVSLAQDYAWTDQIRTSGLPNCPVRPDQPQNIPPLDMSIVNLVRTLFQNTIGPCKQGPQTPSATALSATLVFGDQTYFFTMGCKDKKNSSEPVTINTLFRLGSITKVFTTDMVLEAVKKGLVSSLDDEIQKYALINPWGKEQPTWRQTLSQQAGLSRSAPCDPIHSRCHFSTEEILSVVKNQRLLFPAGQRASYSNLAFALAGNILAERVCHTSYEKALANLVLNPGGLQQTGVNYTKTVRSQMVVNYLPNGEIPPFSELGWTNPAGGIYSSARDMSHYLHHWLYRWNTDSFFKQNFDLLFLNGDMASGWGAPWEMIANNHYLIRTKGGSLPGVSTIMGLIPELSFGFAALWNGEGFNPRDVADSIGTLTIPWIVQKFVELNNQQFPPAPQDFIKQGYPGRYYFPDSTMYLDIRVIENNVAELVVYDTPNESKFLLKPGPGNPQSPNGGFEFQAFTNESTPQSTCFSEQFAAIIGEWALFNKDKDGTPQLQIPGIMYGTTMSQKKPTKNVQI